MRAALSGGAAVVLWLSLSGAGAPHTHATDHHEAVPRPAAVAGHLASDAADASDPHDVTGTHGDAEGLRLVAASGESVEPGASCASEAPRRRYEIAAIAVDITLNRYLDHDPLGRAYALVADIAAIRTEEAANRAARSGRGEPAVSTGLQGDALQPLTLRVLPGECLVLTLQNQLADEPASLHLHGSSLRIADTGAPAVAADPDATAPPGATVAYEWLVPPSQPEATHYFHSHGSERFQTSHGLFGAVIVEPAGSTWTDPLTGEPTETGWQAIVTPPDAPAFREFTLYYHEIGDENYQLLDGEDLRIPLVDPITSAYRPGARALNYRSEPFMNRLLLAESLGAPADESLEYSSYTYGDPATPLPRAYLGDPVKQRVLHAGSEVFHVHHVHGGTTRWPRQPGIEGDEFGAGLDKDLPLTPAATERTDSQSLGPSETFDVEPECAAGGCQQVAGDFMYHCHVAHHYFAGMWGISRTYNTLQDGVASTDGLPPLLALPDRVDETPAAVTSDALLGTQVDPGSGPLAVTPVTLPPLVEDQLPPAGVPADGDASVFDWTRDGDRYLNEPETDADWPGYRSDAPGTRPPLLFDPRSGRLAYPLLRPHLLARPPFAPGHGPAPFLDPIGNGRDPPAPGVSGPASLCPEGTSSRRFDINAIRVPVPINVGENILDPNGMLFVLRAQRDQAMTDPALQVPLALRTNAGVDCIDVLLRSELRDDPVTPFSKVGIHIHFVQFDVQGSDGVNVGFNYEQTVRPYAATGTTTTAAAAAGADALAVADPQRFRPGALVGVGMERDEGFEVARIAAVEGGTLRLAEPLREDHDAGEFVSAEFVRYRWYPDVQFGTAYFHDHVDGLTTWEHGLFGALVAEPPDATWTDPETGAPLLSGPIADVHTELPVGHDVTGSFRELLLFTQDGNRLTHERRSGGGTLNLRAEPLDRRAGAPESVFDSSLHGDPETPIVQAHLGDPVVIRDLVGAANEVHTLHVDGHWFRTEAWSETSPPVATVDVGISERYDVVIASAGGPQGRTGDYLYENGRAVKLEEGNWGLLRVLDTDDPSIRPLPHTTDDPSGEAPICPTDAPRRTFDVAAVTAPLPMLGGDEGIVFATTDVADAVAAGTVAAEPLVLRATVGDCLEVTLTNRLEIGSVDLRTDLLARDPGGVAAGDTPGDPVAPGASATTVLYASPEVGETVALVRDGGDVLGHVGRGAYGAIVIAAAGSRFLDPVTGEDLGDRSSWRADVVPPEGEAYRDAVLLWQDEDASIGTHRMPYTIAVEGTIGVNYRSEPLAGRSFAEAIAAGPGTPVIEAVSGDPIRLHVLAPWSEQARVFAVEGHTWPQEPGRTGTPRLASRRIGGLQALTLHLTAGGPDHLDGDYVYGDHRAPYTEAGAWGVLRVSRGPTATLRSLGGGRTTLPLGAVAGALLWLVAWLLWRTHRVRES